MDFLLQEMLALAMTAIIMRNVYPPKMGLPADVSRAMSALEDRVKVSDVRPNVVVTFPSAKSWTARDQTFGNGVAAVNFESFII